MTALKTSGALPTGCMTGIVQPRPDRRTAAISMTWKERRSAPRRLFLVQFAANVRPELFHHDGQCVVADLRSPHAGGVADIAIASGMITVGRNSRRQGAAQHFRDIELLVS